MANIVFNIAKGRVAQLAKLEGANDALVFVPLTTTGLQTDAVLKDYDTLAAILAASNDEQTEMGRKTLTGVTVAPDDAADTNVVDAADVTWAAATGVAVSKLILCYNPDTTTATDADLIPLCAYDFVVTPTGTDITAQVNVAGLFSAA